MPQLLKCYNVSGNYEDAKVKLFTQSIGKRLCHLHYHFKLRFPLLMIRVLIWVIFLMSFTVAISCRQQDAPKITFYPLHPYSASPTDYDSTIEKSKAYIIKYYVTRGSIKATEELSYAVDSFLTTSIRNDSINFNEYGSYLVYVFKESKKTNKNYRNRGTDDTPDSHIDDDLLYKYNWHGGHFSECELYGNGRVIKTIVNKSKPILDELFSRRRR